MVILSLITSFWTLASRVAADDKQMFKKEWKSMSFKFKWEWEVEVETEKEEEEAYRYGCFNHRWFIRVVLWRYLEITCRITLLCLIWINLGGLSIFIMLGLEMVYLSIICFGLGTYVISMLF